MNHKLALSVPVSWTLLLLPLLSGCAGGGGGSSVNLGPIGAGLTFIGLGIVLSSIIGLFNGPKK